MASDLDPPAPPGVEAEGDCEGWTESSPAANHAVEYDLDAANEAKEKGNKHHSAAVRAARFSEGRRACCSPGPVWGVDAGMGSRHRCVHRCHNVRPARCQGRSSSRARQPAWCPEANARAPTSSQERAVYHGNRAACYLKLEQYDAVVEDCTAALEVEPAYGKALARRCKAYESMEKYTEALADARKLSDLEGKTRMTEAHVKRLESLEAEKLEKDKEEMMGAETPRSCVGGGR